MSFELMRLKLLVLVVDCRQGGSEFQAAVMLCGTISAMQVVSQSYLIIRVQGRPLVGVCDVCSGCLSDRAAS